jgi:hypothetical protein
MGVNLDNALGKKGVKFKPIKDNTKSTKPIKINIQPKIFILGSNLPESRH